MSKVKETIVTDEIVERAARALAKSDFPNSPYESFHTAWHERYTRYSRAALTAVVDDLVKWERERAERIESDLEGERALTSVSQAQYKRAKQANAALTSLLEKAGEALEVLLRRDERNTCQHEETHRGGFLWEICDACGMKWADDESGKPEWKDPHEWDRARSVLSEIEAHKANKAPPALVKASGTGERE